MPPPPLWFSIDDRLAQGLRQPLADLPRDEIDAAAGLNRRDDLDRLRGITALRDRDGCRDARRDRQADARKGMLPQHGSSVQARAAFGNDGPVQHLQGIMLPARTVNCRQGKATPSGESSDAPASRHEGRLAWIGSIKRLRCVAYC